MTKNAEKTSSKINTAARKSTQAATIKTPPTMQAAALPSEGYARIWHVVGSRKKGIQGVLPMSRSSFLKGVKDGKLNIKPVKLGERTTGYKVEEIRALIAELGGV